MDNLPLELIEYIFNYLNLKDKIRCRRINKFFLYSIDNYLIGNKNDLLITETFKSYYHYLRPFFIDNYLNDNNLILEFNLNEFFFKHSILILKNKIKQLVICELTKSNLISILKSLDKIEILILYNFKDQNNLFIKLDHLKILELINCESQQFKFYLPSLKKLSIDFSIVDSGFKFIYPESIEYCKLNRYHNLIDKFINLKILYCYEFSNENSNLEDNFLTYFSKLNELHLDEIEYFKIFKKQQTIYQLNQIKIYLFGLQLNNLDDYKECRKKFNSTKFDLYVKNQLKLTDHRIPFKQNELDFELIKSIYNKLPKKFFLKLDGIHDCLCLQNAIIKDELIDFLKFSSIRFSRLEFSFFNLSDRFFKNLFLYCPYLNSIAFLNYDNNSIKIEQNLIILYQFTNLIQIEFGNLEITFDSAINLFKKLNNLQCLYFDFNNQELGLYKNQDNFFELYNYDNVEKGKIMFKDLESIDFNRIL